MQEGIKQGMTLLFLILNQPRCFYWFVWALAREARCAIGIAGMVFCLHPAPAPGSSVVAPWQLLKAIPDKGVPSEASGGADKPLLKRPELPCVPRSTLMNRGPNPWAVTLGTTSCCYCCRRLLAPLVYPCAQWLESVASCFRCPTSLLRHSSLVPYSPNRTNLRGERTSCLPHGGPT